MNKTVFAVLALSLLSTATFAAAPNGEKLFQDNCAVCHGSKGEGKTAPVLAGDASDWEKKLFERAVLEGIDDKGVKLEAPMPHWQDASFKSDHGHKPTKAEVDAIQHYLQSMK